jgi:hypothetical protein
MATNSLAMIIELQAPTPFLLLWIIPPLLQGTNLAKGPMQSDESIIVSIKIAAHPAIFVATPGLSRVPRPVEYYSEPCTPGTHEGGQPCRRPECHAV